MVSEIVGLLAWAASAPGFGLSPGKASEADTKRISQKSNPRWVTMRVRPSGTSSTHAALRRVLERGGVVGGSSAGATIVGDYLVRARKDAITPVITEEHTVWEALEQMFLAGLRGIDACSMIAIR